MDNLALQIIVFLCFALIYFLLDAYHDSSLQNWRSAQTLDQVNKYSERWHKADALIKGIVGGLISYLLFDGINVRTVLYWCLFLNIRWIWFDGWLNIFNGLPINYVGKTAVLDRIFKRPGMQFAFKFVALAFLIVSLFFVPELTNLINSIF